MIFSKAMSTFIGQTQNNEEGTIKDKPETSKSNYQILLPNLTFGLISLAVLLSHSHCGVQVGTLWIGIFRPKRFQTFIYYPIFAIIISIIGLCYQIKKRCSRVILRYKTAMCLQVGYTQLKRRGQNKLIGI